MSTRQCRLPIVLALSAVWLTACPLPAVAADEGDPAASLVARGRELYKEGRYQEARNTLVRVLNADPENTRAADLLGVVKAALRRSNLDMYRRAAEEDERRAEADLMGKPEPAAVVADETTRAVADQMAEAARPERPVEIDPERVYNRAEALAYRGEYDAARTLLARIEPGDGEPFNRAQLLTARIEAWQAKHPGAKAGGRELNKFLAKKLERDYKLAKRLFNEGRWLECIAACRRVRRYAPHDARVRQLYRDARMELTSERVRDAAADGELATFEMLAETERLASPDVPDVKVKRPEIEPEATVLSPEEIALEKKLNEKVSMDLIDAPLSYVLDLLTRAVGMNIIVDPAAVQDKVITINVHNTSVREVLDFITRSTNVTYTKTQSSIYVTTPDQPMLELRIIRLSKGLTDALQDVTPKAQQGGGDQQQQQQQQQQGGAGGAKPSGTSDMERLLEEIEMGLIDWPAGSRYYLDRKRNVLFLRSTAAVCDKVQEMIKVLDENPIQVKVTTRFIEIDAEDFKDLGINWNVTGNYALTREGGEDQLVVDAGTGTTFDPRVATEAEDAVSSADGFTFGLTGILTNPQFQATMKTLRAKFKGRVINAPSVTATSNSPAKFIESKDLWYVDDYRIDRTDLTGAEGVETSEPIVVPEFRRDASTGFSLTVTPSIGRDSRDITLLIEPIFRRKSLDSITQPVVLPEGLQQKEAIALERPVVVDRRIWVKVTVRDGYHVVLGGMVNSSKKEIESKVPILGDIPFLGWAFKRTSLRDVRKHLIIIVSARILDSRGYKYLTEEEEQEQARQLSA
ncbi:MAG: hypothetical protein ACOC8E_03845, partial [Planctomycetota bacterium]